MALEEVDSLRDPDLSDGEGLGGKAKKAKKSKKSNGAKKGGIPLPMVVFLATSPLVIFGTVWLTLSRMPLPETGPAAADSLAVLPDSLSLAVPDTVQEAPPRVLTPEEQEAQMLAEVDSTLSGAMGARENNRSERMKILQAMARLRDRIGQKNAELKTLEKQVEDRDKLATELAELQAQSAAQEERLRYLEQSMPDNIVKKLREYDAERQATAQQQAAVQAQVSEDKLAQMRRLSKIYSDMKPAEAAPILQQLNVDDVTLILKGMRSRSAAKIMAQFKPAFSARISKRMGSTQ